MLDVTEGMSVRLAGVLLIAALSGNAQAFDYAAYPRTTLQAAAAAQPRPDPSVDVGVSAVVFKHSVVVAYVEPARPLAQDLRALVEYWGRIKNQNAEFAKKFSKQVRVKEGNTLYDLPIQDALIRHLDEEAKSGDTVTLYVMWIGNTKTQSVFLINEFAVEK